MKICPECKADKPESEYYVMRHTFDGLNWRCNPCQNAYNREYTRQRALAKLDPEILSTYAHAPDESRLIKFVRKIKIVETGCWKWIGSLHPNTGYPRFWFSKHTDKLAHRVSYEWSRDLIPEKMTIDHLCKKRWCVNPDHLEVVTRGENNLRGESPWAINKRKTHCLRGHEFTAENTWSYQGMRHCRECGRIKKVERRAKLRLAGSKQSAQKCR